MACIFYDFQNINHDRTGRIHCVILIQAHPTDLIPQMISMFAVQYSYVNVYVEFADLIMYFISLSGNKLRDVWIRCT